MSPDNNFKITHLDVLDVVLFVHVFQLVIAGVFEQRHGVLRVVIVRAHQLETRTGAAEIQTAVVFRIKLRVVQVQPGLRYAQRLLDVLFELFDVVADHVRRPREHELQQPSVLDDEHLSEQHRVPTFK